MSQYDIKWDAVQVPGAGVHVGYAVCKSTLDKTKYTVANTANLTAVGRYSGVAITEPDQFGMFAIQYSGEVSTLITGLGNGAANSPVIISSTGLLARKASPAAADYVVGTCDADGDMTLSSVGGGVGVNLPAGTEDYAYKTVGAAAVWAPVNRTVRTLEEFGGKGDNSTDNLTAWNSAMAALVAQGGGTLLLAAGTYLKSATGTQVPAGCTIRGAGVASTLKTAANAPIVDVGGEDVGLYDFRVLGNSTGATQHGIQVGHDGVPGTGFSRVHIKGVRAEACGGRGISLEWSAVTGLGPRVADCMAYNCVGTGFYVLTSDYVSITGCVAYGNGTGLYLGSGNMAWVGGDLSWNTTGVLVDIGAGNDAHGVVAATRINHNAHAVTVNSITNGQLFRSCEIYYGDIVVTSGAGVRFIGCQVDVTGITASGAGVVVDFSACAWPMANANTVTQSSGGVVRMDPGNLLTTGLGADLGVDRSLDASANNKIGFAFAGTRRGYVDPAHGLGYFGGGGSDTKAVLGPLTGFETSYCGFWALPNASSPSASNPVLYSDSTNTFVNGCTATGAVQIISNGTTFLATFDPVTSGGLTSLKQPYTRAMGWLATNPQSLTLANGLNSNIGTTTSFGRITNPTGAFSVGGFAGGGYGEELTIHNTTAQTMTIVNEDVSSTATSRITTLTGGNVALPAGTSWATFHYDTTSTRWILLGCGQGGPSSGITQLTGDVTAGPGSGSVAASVINITGSGGKCVVASGVHFEMGTGVMPTIGDTLRVPATGGMTTHIAQRYSVSAIDLPIMSSDATGLALTFGDTSTPGTAWGSTTLSGGNAVIKAANAGFIQLWATNTLYLDNGGTEALRVNTASAGTTTIQYAGTVTASNIVQAQGSGSTDGSPMNITAQKGGSGVGKGNNGGNLTLSGGDGQGGGGVANGGTVILQGGTPGGGGAKGGVLINNVSAWGFSNGTGLTATSASTGANGAVPAQVVGYLITAINGTNFKIPYFNT